MNKYIQILKESLEKKIILLHQISILNEKQKNSIVNQSEEEFEECLEIKNDLIQQINLLDQGFESLYEKVKTELEEKRSNYLAEISQMQGLIQEIVSYNVKIQAEESRNKQLIEQYFESRKKSLGKQLTGAKAAINRYGTNNRTTYAEPHFLDQKK